MKILQTISGLSAKSGGPSTCTRDLMEGFAMVGGSVDLLTMAADDNLGKGYVWLHEVKNDMRTPLGFSKNFREALRQSYHDVYHANALWSYINHVTCEVAREKGRPYIISPHGMLYPNALHRHYWKKWPMLKLWFEKDIREASALHVMCEEEMRHCRDFGYKGPIAIIPNPVAVPEEYASGNIIPKKKSIGYLGRLHPYKRPDALIRAWASVLDAVADWELVIMGSGEPQYERSLVELASGLGLKNVRFMGMVTGDEKYKELASLRALCCPSVSENFGMSVAEALLCHTPVICTKTAPWELLETEHCGWWCDNDEKTLAAKILEAIALDEATLREMGQRGHDATVALCSQESVANKMLSLYRWLVDGGERPEFVR